MPRTGQKNDTEPYGKARIATAGATERRPFFSFSTAGISKKAAMPRRRTILTIQRAGEGLGRV